MEFRSRQCRRLNFKVTTVVSVEVRIVAGPPLTKPVIVAERSAVATLNERPFSFASGTCALELKTERTMNTRRQKTRKITIISTYFIKVKHQTTHLKLPLAISVIRMEKINANRRLISNLTYQHPSKTSEIHNCLLIDEFHDYICSGIHTPLSPLSVRTRHPAVMRRR